MTRSTIERAASRKPQAPFVVRTRPHLAIVPVLLGAGEALLTGIDLPALGYSCTEHVPTALATHVVLSKA